VRQIVAIGLDFSCREAGPLDGEPVILLHGFPETSHMWTGLMPELTAAGYRCLAPDQRGYSEGARPEGEQYYGYEQLSDDIIALADAWSAQRFHLIGHDWGSIVGWAVVDRFPERIASWTAMSVPHAKAFAIGVRDDPEQEGYRQILKAFMAPGLMEQALPANDFAVLRAAWSSSSPEEVADYIRVLGQPGATTAALNWYRCSDAHARSLDDDGPVKFGPVATPTLLLWGRNDENIRPYCVKLAGEYMTGPYEVVELDAGHWLAQERPAEVRDAIVAHLRNNSIG
jgi:pimeloyl-ACP methyl ester carboxylesterase